LHVSQWGRNAVKNDRHRRSRGLARGVAGVVVGDEIGFARSLLADELPGCRLKPIDGHLRRTSKIRSIPNLQHPTGII
jgi:hypothetical protein